MYLNKSHPQFDYAKEILCVLRPGGELGAVSWQELHEDLGIDPRKLTALIRRMTEKMGFVVHLGYLYDEKVVYVPESAWPVAERHANRYWEQVYE